MSDLQETLEKALRGTLIDPEGAGSDLIRTGNAVGPLMYVEGNLDVQHLASHVIDVLGLDDYEYNVKRTSLDDGFSGIFRDVWLPKDEAEQDLADYIYAEQVNEEEQGFRYATYALVKRRKAGKVEDV